MVNKRCLKVNWADLICHTHQHCQSVNVKHRVVKFQEMNLSKREMGKTLR